MIEVNEPKPGHVGLTCKISGKPITRTNQYGMFCSDPECQCEKESMNQYAGLKSILEQFKKFDDR